MANKILKDGTVSIVGAGNALIRTCSAGLTGTVAGSRKFIVTSITGTISGAGAFTIRDGGAAGTIKFQMTMTGAGPFHYDNLNVEFQTDCHAVNVAAVNLMLNVSGYEQ